MKKILLITLILISIPLYSYDLFLLFRVFISSEKNELEIQRSTNFSFDKLLVNAAPVRFEDKGKSPFVPYKVTPKPVVTVSPKKLAATPSAAKEPPKPPAIVITGIMWNPSSPVAMITLPDGSSAVAKAGQKFGSINVKKIEQNRILVVNEGKEFWITR